MQVSIEVIGLLSLFITFLLGYGALRAQVQNHEKKFVEIETRSERSVSDLKENLHREYAAMKETHDTAIKALHFAQSEREKAIWEKFETQHKILLSITQQIGRVEGKLDGKSE